MKKIIYLTLLSLITFQFHAQFNTIDSDKIYKEYGNVIIYDVNYLDKENFIARGVIITHPIQTSVLFNTSFENGKYSIKQIDIKSKDVNYKDEYIKIENKIFRIRAEKIKKEIHFFKDELVNNSFINSTIPFYRGSTEDGNLDEFILTKAENNFVITCKTIKNYFVKKISINQFDINTNELISKKTIDIEPDFNLLEKKIQISSIGDKYILYYSKYDQSEKINKLIYYFTSNNQIEKSSHSYNSGEIVMNYIFIENNNEIQLYNFNISNNFTTSLSTVDLENSSIEEFESQKISIENIARDYTDKKGKIVLTDQLNNANFISYNLIEENNDEKYIINYGANETTEGSYYLDIMVTKIKGNQIIWNQYFGRNAKRFIPTFQNTGDELQFFDEDVICIDEINGVQQIRGKCIDLKGKSKKFIVKINKLTGELVREVIE